MDKIPHPELDKEDHGSPKEELINRSDFICPQHQIKTPTTSNEVLTLRKQIEDDLIRNGLLNTPCKLRICKLANGAENAFADRAILRDENHLLFEQNNESNVWRGTKSTIQGTAKVMAYEDLMEAERERDNKKAAQEAGRGRGRAKQNKPASQQILGKRSCSQELEEEINKIEAGELKMYCNVLCFN